MTTSRQDRPDRSDHPDRNAETESFAVRTDRTLVRAFAHSRRYLLVDVVAPTAPPRTDGRAPVNLAFVLDRSGSMAGRKLELAKTAVASAVERLRPTDRFSLVVYDTDVEVVTESHHATDAHRREALDRLGRISAGSSTALAEGWLRGCEQVALHLSAEGIDRALLLTDGLANVGETDPEALARHARELRERGISTSTFGVGADFDEGLLAAMADAGGGNFYFIERAEQIADLMTSEVGEALEVVAREAAIEVVGPSSVRVEVLGPQRVEARGSRTVVELGDLVSGQTQSLVLRLGFPLGTVGEELGLIVGLHDRAGVLRGGPAKLAWTFADNAANDVQPRDRDVDRAVAQAYAARARIEAAELNKIGRYDEAASRLRHVADRIGVYAGRDDALRRVASELRDESERVARPMPALALKDMQFASRSYLRSRTAEGKASRGPQA